MVLWAQVNCLLIIILFALCLICWRADINPDNRPWGVLTFISVGLPLSGIVLLSNIFFALYVSVYV